MTTDLDRAARREEDVAALEGLLDAWSKKLDAVLARATRVGRDPGFRVRIDGLRARHAALQSGLARFEAAGARNWESFQAEIANDRQSFELAIEDLS